MRDIPNLYQESHYHESPERNLWFAVIERALKDYCFFFDKLLNPSSAQLVNYNGAEHKNQFQLKAIYEFNRLRWFLFEKESEEFNLTYLADQLYEDGDGAAACIRREAIKQFKTHFNEAEKNGRFMALIHYIKENTGVEKAIAAEKVSSLRNKRYRINT